MIKSGNLLLFQFSAKHAPTLAVPGTSLIAFAEVSAQAEGVPADKLGDDYDCGVVIAPTKASTAKV